ncbi:hydroxycarboxylic acid receptor 2-like [Fundulus heteroclitus]|uniref:hydroxycarboxylic acid receptor 2-like n=1 Tax=Fundulus heteroclitus TaxID=8078 RepID=UPI00165CE3B6|nr:hydroxycarboxylic acid receptor 2-like [Fundulus heteroclitus]
MYDRFKFWKNNCVFLFNIVLADFLLLTFLPLKIYHYQNNQRGSEEPTVCGTLLFLRFLNRGASTVFLTMMSLDRYFSVVHLGKKNCFKAFKNSPLISVIVWVSLLPFTIPTMVRKVDCCNSWGREVSTLRNMLTDSFRETIFFSQIVIPYIILIYCTARIVSRLRRKTIGEKAKLTRAVFAVVSVAVVFSICFLPCTIARAALLIVRVKEWTQEEEVATQVYDALMVLSYADCLLDPLVYCFCNSGFKVAYISTFCPSFLKQRLLEFVTGPLTATTTTTLTSGAQSNYSKHWKKVDGGES